MTAVTQKRIKKENKTMFKLNIHSIVDVITNSSTVIYTYQNSTEEAKELLQEILNLMGEEKEVDDLFNMGVFLSDDSYYEGHLAEDVDEENMPEDYPTEDWKAQGRYFTDLKEKILKGEVEKPEWMKNAEEKETWSGYAYPTSLHIIPKDEKYNGLIKKILAFLNSLHHEAFRDG